MLRVKRREKWAQGLLVVALATLAAVGLTAPAGAAITIGFNPTGGGIGGTSNVGTLQVGVIDEAPGNAIAVGFNKAAATPTGFRLPNPGETFTLTYQAVVSSLLDANGKPIFTYGTSAGGNTGQLTAVASFTEVVDAVTLASASFHTTGGGSFSFYFNPTQAANNQTGLDFAPGTPGNTQAAGTFTTVYSGPILPGLTGSFTGGTTPGQNAGALDQSPGGNAYPGVNTIAGSGGSNISSSTTTANPAFFTTLPPSLLPFFINLTNSSNNLPYNQIHPSSIFWNGQAGASNTTSTGIGTNNGGADAAGNPLAANVMFQADANTSFAVPEPSSVVLGAIGLGSMVLVGLRAQRRRGRPAKV